MKKQNYNSRNKKGIALLIAIIATSALLLASFAISDISFKQQVISYSGRESKVAFYVADAGLECALYHDLRIENFFPTPPSPTLSSVNCSGQTNIPVAFQVPSDPGENPAVSWFAYNFPALTSNSCVVVQVIKDVQSDNSIKTTITARGYNNSCNLSTRAVNPGPRNVERALEVTY